MCELLARWNHLQSQRKFSAPTASRLAFFDAIPRVSLAQMIAQVIYGVDRPDLVEVESA